MNILSRPDQDEIRSRTPPRRSPPSFWVCFFSVTFVLRWEGNSEACVEPLACDCQYKYQKTSGARSSRKSCWDTGMLATATPDDALVVFPADAPGRRAEPSEMGKVFVGGLSRETTTDGLRVYFERFGDISDCVVMKDRATGVPRGFGFVTYASHMVADRVVHHRHVIDGKEVEAKPAVPRESDSLAGVRAGPLHAGGVVPAYHMTHISSVLSGDQTFASNKIFVGGLSHETSEADFVNYFGMLCLQVISPVISK
jgi:hypothetical protein